MHRRNKSIFSRPGVLGLVVAVATFVATALAAPTAMAAFGFNGFDLAFRNENGTAVTQAGSHPDEMTTSFTFNYEGEFFESTPEGEAKNLFIDQIPGFVGNPGVVPKCAGVDFLAVVEGAPSCPRNTVVGIMGAKLEAPEVYFPSNVFNLVPPPGVVARLGFVVLGVPVTVDIGLKQSPPYNVVASLTKIAQPLKFYGSSLTLWGKPAAPSHDSLRGECLFRAASFAAPPDYAPTYYSTGESCPAGIAEKPFLTVPGTCAEPLSTEYRADSWENPGSWVAGSVLTHDEGEPPAPASFTGCGRLGFRPTIDSAPTTKAAGSGSGFDFQVNFDQSGLENPDGYAQSTIKKAEIVLPEGLTVNPSLAEGVGVCSPGDLASEGLSASPGNGCPEGSDIGTVEVETPLLERTVQGTVYLARPYDNLAENSLVAFYIVLRDPRDGILVKLPAKVSPDPSTGQLVTTVKDIPQLPFSHFRFHFREGQRAPLITPPSCGTFTAEARMTPWARPSETVTASSSFDITKGVNSGQCPPGGAPPFDPSFSGGTLSNSAGSYSPFNMRLQRSDGEQDLTKFSATLPPGVVGNLSGVEKCPDSAIADAKAKTGLEELASASCPPGSEIGQTLAGAGVGTALTYVPGKIYLGGPYHGDPLSVIAITPAVAGPFDAGTVVVQEALTLNPRTAEVEVDGSSSDPIPHILKGIPLKLRELRVEVNRPKFTLNATSCAPSSVRASLWGSFLDMLSPADDRPVDLSNRYQAADCQALGFESHLGLHLKGGTRRGAYPGLKAVYTPRKGDANLKNLVVRLPRSAFLEQGHIRTICTRVQYAATNCPKAARYGYVKAWTPLLDEPLQGPVWLRSSNHKLPDMVFDLRGLVDVEVDTRIDSVHGGIRATVEDAPDAPISRVILHMQGGKKGLIVNSRNLCYKPGRNRANVNGTGQNGKQFTAKSLVQARCARARKHKRHHRRAKRARVARGSWVE